MPIKGKPILAWVIEHIDRTCQGLDKIIVCINEAFRDQFEWNLAGIQKRVSTVVSATVDSEDLGTAGELLPMKREIDGDFLVYYGDIICNLNVGEMVREHEKRQPAATLAISPTHRVLKGVIETGQDGYVKSFVEKPRIPMPNWCGIGVFSPVVMKYIKIGYDLSHDVIPAMLRNGEKILPYVQEGFWYLDIGSIVDYREAGSMVEKL